MAKWANYLIIGGVISMITPFILDYFELLHNHYFWPVLSIILITVGISIHVFNSAQNGSVNGQTILLLASLFIIVAGFSLTQLDIEYTEYLLLLGLVMVVVWIFTPNRNKQ